MTSSFDQFSGDQRQRLIQFAKNLIAISELPRQKLRQKAKDQIGILPFYVEKATDLLEKGWGPAQVEAIILNYKDVGEYGLLETMLRRCCAIFARTYGLGKHILADELNALFGSDMLSGESATVEEKEESDEDEFDISGFVNEIWEKEALSESTKVLENYLGGLSFDIWAPFVPVLAKENTRQFIAALAGASGSAIALVMRYLQEEPAIAREVVVSLKEQIYNEEISSTAQEFMIHLIKEQVEKKEEPHDPIIGRN